MHCDKSHANELSDCNRTGGKISDTRTTARQNAISILHFVNQFYTQKTLTKHARALLQVKGLYTKSACGKYLRKFTRTTSYSWPETNVSVQHTGRSPGLEIITSAAFPVSQWHIGFCSLITVTSSHRTFTCFPFHQNQYNDALS